MRFLISIWCVLFLTSCMVTHEVRIKELEAKVIKLEKFRKKTAKRIKALEEPG